MFGILSGGLLVVAFAAMAGLALLVVVRLHRIGRLSESPGGRRPAATPATGGQAAGGQSAGGQSAGRRAFGRPGQRPDA